MLVWDKTTLLCCKAVCNLDLYRAPPLAVCSCERTMEVLYKLERTIPFTSSLILEANWRSMWLVRKSTDWPEPSRWHNSFQELRWSPLESTCAVVPFLLPRNELCHRRSGQSWPSSRSLTRIWRVPASCSLSRTVLIAHVCRLRYGSAYTETLWNYEGDKQVKRKKTLSSVCRSKHELLQCKV